MDLNGIDIESHTVNHDQLDKLTYDKQVTTLKESKEYVEKLVLLHKKQYVHRLHDMIYCFCFIALNIDRDMRLIKEK